MGQTEHSKLECKRTKKAFLLLVLWNSCLWTHVNSLPWYGCSVYIQVLPTVAEMGIYDIKRVKNYQ